MKQISAVILILIFLAALLPSCTDFGKGETKETGIAVNDSNSAATNGNDNESDTRESAETSENSSEDAPSGDNWTKNY